MTDTETANAESLSAEPIDRLAKSYDPEGVERGLYDGWDAAGYFAPSDTAGRPEGDTDPFVMMMPPPNLTGELHVGHALFVTLEDIMARWNRMMGRPTLWLPGADHAGIAGQWVVERQLATEGLTRHDLGREAFLKRTWAYMGASRGAVREQLRVLGASCDWSRFTFTMDEAPSRAVRTVFKRLYDKGLIYRGTRLISWCPRCRTALSDLEVVHRDEASFLWHLRYPVEGEPDRMIEVATTRPETFFGDTAVAVHPDDGRYTDLIGRNVVLPIIGRSIPVIADEHVDPAFGTGAVKVTPAHDPNDYEIGQRHDLPQITVMNLDGTMNAEAGPFDGMPVNAAREAVVARLASEGNLGAVTPHTHSVGHCDRCGTVVEPMISLQWFLAMEELAKPALAAASDGRLTFVPDRHRVIYTNWLENIHDWCISRQLWWGHRIPVWYCDDPACTEPIVTDEAVLESCPRCGGAVHQDPDVLDTWFSSGLWPFSTLGWPDQTADLARFYPGSVLETGYDIIFTWVSRMVFFGLEIMGEVPFHTVYMHGLVRDADGAKMSKTKGNVIDPIAMAQEYGADSLRFALMTAGSPVNDVRIGPQRVETARNFANKLWNATRFALRAIDDCGTDITLGTDGPARPAADAFALTTTDRWIISRLDGVTASSTALLAGYQFGEAARQIQDFIWSELCDWYIEAAKVRLRGTPEERAAVGQTLAFVLERSVRLLHPFMPFVTESLWQALPHTGDSIMVAPWPEAGEVDVESEAAFEALIELVEGIRNARAESGIEPGRRIAAEVFAGVLTAQLLQMSDELVALARLDREKLRFFNPVNHTVIHPGDGSEESLTETDTSEGRSSNSDEANINPESKPSPDSAIPGRSGFNPTGFLGVDPRILQGIQDLTDSARARNREIIQATEGLTQHVRLTNHDLAAAVAAFQRYAQNLGQSLTVVTRHVNAALPLAGMIDLGAERDRLRREIADAEAERGRATAQLGNESFMARAPEKVVEVQRKRLATAEEQIAVLSERLADLG